MIKVLLPDMPTAQELDQYLCRIDEARWYSNRGPLVQELENRLADMCGTRVVAVSSGTTALELVMRYHAPYYSYADVPALTFCATGLAAMTAGLEVILRDVSGDLQMHPGDQSGHEAVMVPVATFGRPVDIAQWEDFHNPVVIDAAGAFPAQEVSKDKNIATCFSLHATKFVGAGEGGFIASADDLLMDSVSDMANFGKYGTNAKISEYTAAVALAALDRMHEKEFETRRVNLLYDDYSNGILFCPTPEAYTTLKVAVMPAGVSATAVSERMLAAGVQTKQWYRPYLHERIEFIGSKGQMPVTDSVMDRLLGVPFHTGLTRRDVAWVMKSLREAIYAQ